MIKKLAASWLNNHKLKLLFDVLQSRGASVRLVGGAVRDGLLGLPAQDFDIAINIPPEEVIKLLKNHQISAIPTGIEHGTITAVIEKQPFEITTLRKDIETYGRRARVSFTDDWVKDAGRRDFTINAIYADADGTLFDPFDGMKDLEQRCVRFIGDPYQRIQEDFLRILRFFRFSARFGESRLNQQGIEACQKLAYKIPLLSVERITDEFLNLLSVIDPTKVLIEMHDSNILQYIVKAKRDFELFKAICVLEERASYSINPIRRLVALEPERNSVLKKLKLSNKQKAEFDCLSHFNEYMYKLYIKRMAYKLGKKNFASCFLLFLAQKISRGQISVVKASICFNKVLSCLDKWEIPTLPINGNDLKEQGVKDGIMIGTVLKAVEEWWCQKRFLPNRKDCLRYAKTVLKNNI